MKRRNISGGRGSRDVKVSERGKESAVRTEGSRHAPDSPRATLASAGGHIVCDGQAREESRKEVRSGEGAADSQAMPRSASFGVRSAAVEAKTTATARSTGVVPPLLLEVPRSAPAAVATNFPAAYFVCLDAVDNVKTLGVSGRTNAANGAMYEYERKIQSSPVVKAGGDGDRIRDAPMHNAAAEPSTTAVQVVSMDPINDQPSVSVGGAGTIDTIADGDKVLFFPGDNCARGVIYDGGGCEVGINVAGAVKDRGLREQGLIAPLGVAVSAWEGHSGASRGDQLGVQG